MEKELKEKKSKGIDLAKLISQEELTAIISVVRSRQEFFQKTAKERKEAEEKSMMILEERMPGDKYDKEKENLKLLMKKLMDEADKIYLSKYEEELKHQSGMVEFLHRFTNEKFEDLTETFSLQNKNK